MMALRVEWVPYGRGAAEALRAQVGAVKGDDPLAPVTVVVPSNHVGVATRRLLASGSLGPISARGIGLAAVTFVTPYRLAELLGAPVLAGAGRRPVSTPVIAVALRAALADDAGLFAPVAQHDATETALVAAYRELREVSEQGLDAVAATGPRAKDVVRLHRAARATLEPDWYDEQDLMTAAADALRTTAAAQLGKVVVYLPQQLTPHAARLLKAAGEATDVTVLVGCTGDDNADAEVERSLNRLTKEQPTKPTVEPNGGVTPVSTRIVLVSDSDDEVRVAVRKVIDAVRAGIPLDRIAILHASAVPYARLAHEHLAAAQVKVNGPAVVPLAGRMAGRVLLDLLRLPEGDFRRQDVMAWLASAPLLVKGRWIPTTAWERLSREAGVVGGESDWNKRLTVFADEADAAAKLADTDPDALEWRAERLGKNATRARELRTFVLDLIDTLAAAAKDPRAWSERAAWARSRIAESLGGVTRRARWPEAERKAAERVEAALDRLATLDDVEGPVDLGVFTRTLALELESDLGRVGRFGEGVLVGPITMSIGLDLDLVIVLGLAEGTFPAPVRDDSLLPDLERQAAGDELPLRQQRIEREHRQLLATLAGSSNHVLGVPRGDLRRSSERIASRWVLDIASQFAGTRWWTEDLLCADESWVEPSASFEAGLRAVDFPATAQEQHLRSLMVSAPRDAQALVDASTDRDIVRAAITLAARRSGRFTRFDGNLDGLPMRSPVDRATSATRLEKWAACPFRYFVEYVLRADAVENPEDRLQITALDRGNLVHAALERFVLEVLGRPAGEQPQSNEPWTQADRARMKAIGEALCDDFEARGLTGRAVFWHRDRVHILADLQRFLDEDERIRREKGTRPIAAELAFGFGGKEIDAVPFALPDGRELRFHGQADRIDRADDGSLHIVDYKTGSPRDYTQITEEDPAERGLRLQLAVYGAAARAHQNEPDAEVRAEYWFVSQKGDFKSYGYPVNDGVVARVSETLGKIVTGIEKGVFAAHPTAQSTSIFVECDACDPDALGVVELRRAWDRKRLDPQLAPYAALAEPFDEDELEVEEHERTDA
jgi:ATP-dependent helicase/nuclease subunit B